MIHLGIGYVDNQPLERLKIFLIYVCRYIQQVRSFNFFTIDAQAIMCQKGDLQTNHN